MKLTKRTVDSLPAKTKDYFVWDDELKGFGLRILPSGRRTFLVQYRQGGRTRRVKIGRYGNVTPDEARKRAKELLGDVAGGSNPAESIATYRKALTISSLCDRFMKEHVAVHCKPTTEREYRRSGDIFIKPRFGALKINDLKRADVAKLHHDLRHKPTQANRTLGVLSKMFNLAELWGLRDEGTNPTRLIKKYPERRVERFLSPAEIRRLNEVLNACEADGSESAAACNAFRLLQLTGCRLSEIQTLQWADIRPEYIHLRDSKTGARKVPLSSACKIVLSQIDRDAENPYVIVGQIEGHHITDLQKPWRRIRKKADLEDVRIHDLRHTFASIAVMGGKSLPEVAKLLGHTQIQTTARYAHLADDAIKRASEDVGLEIGAAMGLRPTQPKLTVV